MGHGGYNIGGSGEVGLESSSKGGTSSLHMHLHSLLAQALVLVRASVLVQMLVPVLVLVLAVVVVEPLWLQPYVLRVCWHN